MRIPHLLILVMLAAALLPGCASKPLPQTAPLATEQPSLSLTRELEARILAIDPERVTEQEVCSNSADN